MRRKSRLYLLAAVIGLGVPLPAAAAECADLWQWVNTACRRLADTYNKGNRALLISGYSWHTPWTWTKEKRDEENPYAWGGGYGRTVEDADGNTHMVFGLAFLDSHKNVEWQVGYGWSTFWGPRDGIQPGLGYTAMIVQRPDIAKGIPFPALLPLFSLRYGQATLVSTYIPNFGGGINNGSVFYVFGHVVID